MLTDWETELAKDDVNDLARMVPSAKTFVSEMSKLLTRSRTCLRALSKDALEDAANPSLESPESDNDNTESESESESAAAAATASASSTSERGTKRKRGARDSGDIRTFFSGGGTGGGAGGAAAAQ